MKVEKTIHTTPRCNSKHACMKKIEYLSSKRYLIYNETEIRRKTAESLIKHEKGTAQI